MKNYYWIFLIFSLMSSCSGESDTESDNPTNKLYPAQIISPMNESQYDIGEDVAVQISVDTESEISDLKVYMNDTLYAEGLELKDQSIFINTQNGKVGWTKLRIQYRDKEGELHSDTRDIVFFSDLIPAFKSAVIVNTYPHLKTSYTQGLEFYQGKLFEGTGQTGTSILAEVSLNSGELIRSIDLDKTIFGEGITILDDKIYQITYRRGACFVYDMDFNLINEFTYEGEGWGLCNDGKYLIMSNGSSEIVWRDPSNFNVVKKIEVFTNDSSIDSINELELIDGSLFANVYTKDEIIEIDTATGKVLTNINCIALSADGKVAGADVLNGIARNPDNGKIYMTGKWWPKLYEVTFE